MRPEEGGREAHMRGRGAAGIRGPTCAGHPRVWLCVYVFVRVRPERKGRMSMCLAEHVTSNQSCWRALLWATPPRAFLGVPQGFSQRRHEEVRCPLRRHLRFREAR